MRYIGSKNRILKFIESVIDETYGNVSNAVFADLFSGTACVAELFKQKGAKIISNDYLHFSYALQVAKIRVNSIPRCKVSYEDAINILNELEGIEGFFTKEYTIEGAANRNYSRNYFSYTNAKKIDAMCSQLKRWLSSGEINTDMYYLLCASLIDPYLPNPV